MKFTTKILAVLSAAIIALFVGGALGAAAGLNVWAVSGVVFASAFVPKAAGVLGMAIQREIWLEDIVGNLFKKNPHLAHAYSADQFVLSGKVVHIPNAGAKPTVKRNRSSLPATVVQRTDVDITFNLDEYTTDPILITNADDAELSYDKRQSVIGEQSNALAELVGTWMLYYWRVTASAQMIRTSGDSIATHLSGGTGNKKELTVADVKKAQKLMNKNNVPSMERYAILDADMYDQLLDDLTATQYRDFSRALNEKEGIVGKLYGFTFLEPRSDVLRYSNDSTPVPRDPGGDDDAATDNAAGLFWQKDMVIRALGTNDFFENTNDPTYYGDIYSALVRAGGRKRRNDAKGVVAIIQKVA